MNMNVQSAGWIWFVTASILIGPGCRPGQIFYRPAAVNRVTEQEQCRLASDGPEAADHPPMASGRAIAAGPTTQPAATEGPSTQPASTTAKPGRKLYTTPSGAVPGNMVAMGLDRSASQNLIVGAGADDAQARQIVTPFGSSSRGTFLGPAGLAGSQPGITIAGSQPGLLEGVFRTIGWTIGPGIFAAAQRNPTHAACLALHRSGFNPTFCPR